MEPQIQIFWEAKAKNMPQGMSREYFGIYGEVCFIVFRPTGQTGECGEPAPDWNLSETVVYMAKLEKVEDFLVGPGEGKDISFIPLKVLSVRRGKEVPLPEGVTIPERLRNFPDKTLFIETEKDTFYLPDLFIRATDNGHVPTLNGKALSYYYT